MKSKKIFSILPTCHTRKINLPNNQPAFLIISEGKKVDRTINHNFSKLIQKNVSPYIMITSPT